MWPLSCRFSLPARARKALLASDQSQIERTPFFWRHYVRSFTIFFSKRHSGRLRRINVGGALSAARWCTEWKRGVPENAATVKEIRRKASKIAPAYNKGALQYLPDESDN
jgi:hypothetical protein